MSTSVHIDYVSMNKRRFSQSYCLVAEKKDTRPSISVQHCFRKGEQTYVHLCTGTIVGKRCIYTCTSHTYTTFPVGEFQFICTGCVCLDIFYIGLKKTV